MNPPSQSPNKIFYKHKFLELWAEKIEQVIQDWNTVAIPAIQLL